MQDMNNTQTLFKLALKARKNAYAPYSSFKVGAAVLSTKNNFYSGANVENISYPIGTCAEESAISAMITSGDKLIKEIIIVAETKGIISPCGACLQRIKEFSNSKTLIHLANLKGIQKTVHIKDLLPIAFEEDLKK